MTLLLRRSFDLPDIWWRVWHFVLMPIGVGLVCALLLRAGITGYGFGLKFSWWQVAGLYGFSAAAILAVVIGISSVGSYGEICRQDMLAHCDAIFSSKKRLIDVRYCGDLRATGQERSIPAPSRRLTGQIAHRGPDGAGFWFKR